VSERLRDIKIESKKSRGGIKDRVTKRHGDKENEIGK
jgi:hypothetical protein